MATNAGSDHGLDGRFPHLRRVARSAVIAGVAAVALAGCGAAEGPGSDGPSVVATTTILGDVAGRVGECGGLEVSTLIPVGADPHDYAPSSADVRDMVQADLVIANGLGLEEGLTSALESARDDGADILEIAPLVDPRTMESAGHAEAEDDHGDDDHGDDDHDHGALDPHVWLDVARMADAAELIGAELAEVTGDEGLVTCGEQVAAELMATDAEVRVILEAVPDDSRVLVTDHDAFGYFAHAYGFDVAGVVVPGGSTLAEPSSEELAALAEVVRDAGVRAIFANTAHRTVLIEALSAEVGEVSVVELYVGSLGVEGSGAEDYAGMMLTDAQLIAQALSS
jgi:zinc/manganese transport system substrate-binding protein